MSEIHIVTGCMLDEHPPYVKGESIERLCLQEPGCDKCPIENWCLVQIDGEHFATLFYVPTELELTFMALGAGAT